MKHKLFLLTNQTMARKESVVELEWLAYEQSLRRCGQPPIRTNRNHPQSQKKIGPYYLDGYAEPSRKERQPTAWEFLGCAVHCHWMIHPACPLTKGLRATDKNPFGESPYRVIDRFRKKVRFLESQQIKVIYVWECQWMQAKSQNPSIPRFLQSWREKEELPDNRLVPRAALRGGRCEAFRLLYDHQTDKDRNLLYIDKNSLYPTVAIENEFGVGPSELFLGVQLKEEYSITGKGFIEKRTGKECLGLIQATVEAPDSLFLPLLPVMSDKKLVFGLCGTCIRWRRSEFCCHKGKARYLSDVWTIPEIVFALKHGYKLIKAHEALIYKEKAFIFADFYVGLARMKLESEKVPDGCSLEEHAARLNKEMPWLNLKASRIFHNPGRRQFAKLCQNSALGKMSQIDTKRHMKYVRHWKELAELRHNPRVNLKNVYPIHDSLAEAVFENKAQMLGYHRNTQVVVYSHVTAYARISLMRDMLDLMRKGFRLYYTDTDSIIFDIPKHLKESFVKETGLNSPSYGFYKEETKGNILSYCSLGCKNYAIDTEEGEHIVKVRGFSLTGKQARELLSAKAMKEMVCAFLECRKEVKTTSQFAMKIDRRKMTVKNSVLFKNYSNQTFDKRWVADRNLETNPYVETVPFGARHCNYADLITCSRPQ